MLSLGKITAGPQAARYYTDQIARGRDDYYAGEGEAPGTWTGSGAGELGLQGEVDADRFAELLGGAGLRCPPRGGDVAGMDLTFRAPKSVSVLWAVGEPEVVTALAAGHQAAVAEALGYLEREACRARRGAGGGFVGAAFMHRASRAGDPLLHTHVVVGNLTHGPDGRWTALDARHSKELADTDRDRLQAEDRQLRERLGPDRPDPDEADRLATSLQHTTRELDDAHARRDQLEQARGDLSWFARKERAHLGQVVDIYAGEIDRLTAERDALQPQHEDARQHKKPLAGRPWGGGRAPTAHRRRGPGTRARGRPGPSRLGPPGERSRAR
jgi:hypothetical protein